MRILLGLAMVLLLGQANAQSTPAAVAAPKNAATAQSPFQAGRPALKVRPQGDQAIKRTVADAMGFVRGMGAMETTKTLNRLQWLGKGKMTEGTTTYDLIKYSYAVSLHLKAAREDIQRKAGGKVDRLVWVVRDQDAWDESAPGVDAAPSIAACGWRALQSALPVPCSTPIRRA
jgi:hypothetical protein